ncbi:MAG: hypothetical protein K2N64_04755 [Anaeroplasmataceae bacterium]|nr:hypothetical protein [Anaeroplasmataceae bacterium]
MARNTFTFDGGEELTTMGAGWFVSYCWYKNVDSMHSNWKRVSTYKGRISVFNRTRKYFKYWLVQIGNMNEKNLNKGAIGLRGNEIKLMAKKLLDIL